MVESYRIEEFKKYLIRNNIYDEVYLEIFEEYIHSRELKTPQGDFYRISFELYQMGFLDMISVQIWKEEEYIGRVHRFAYCGYFHDKNGIK